MHDLQTLRRMNAHATAHDALRAEMERRLAKLDERVYKLEQAARDERRAREYAARENKQ